MPKQRQADVIARMRRIAFECVADQRDGLTQLGLQAMGRRHIAGCRAQDVQVDAHADKVLRQLLVTVLRQPAFRAMLWIVLYCIAELGQPRARVAGCQRPQHSVGLRVAAQRLGRHKLRLDVRRAIIIEQSPLDIVVEQQNIARLRARRDERHCLAILALDEGRIGEPRAQRQRLRRNDCGHPG